MGSNPFDWKFFISAFTWDIFQTFLSTFIGGKTEEIVVKKDAAQSAVSHILHRKKLWQTLTVIKNSFFFRPSCYKAFYFLWGSFHKLRFLTYFDHTPTPKCKQAMKVTIPVKGNRNLSSVYNTPSPRVTRILVPEKHSVMWKPC